MPYICPICQTSLIKNISAQGYCCKNNHQFDMAKEGYVNLLLAQHKKSKDPGDSRIMMQARRHFLEAGFYQPMAKAVVSMISSLNVNHKPLRVLDIGCGEGYYCRQIEALSVEGDTSFDLHGIDIAKNAILAAAKKQPEAKFIVASNQKMPYTYDFFDLILRIYAPSNDDEIQRVTKKDGFLLSVTPGPRHLWQLKEFIYKEVKPHKTEIPLPKMFNQLENQRIRYTIKPEQDQRMALLQMTPFAWRAKEDVVDKISRANNLEIETDFILTLAKKNR